MTRVTMKERCRTAVVGVLALGMTLALGVGPGGAWAETPAALAKYAGQYAYAGTKEQGVAIVTKAFDEALAERNAAVRAMAKKTFAQRFVETIAIETPPDKIGVKLGELDMVTGEIGKTVTAKGPDGKLGKVTRVFDGGKITETMKNDNGTIINVFQLSADGVTLQREVTVTSSRVGKPVTYQLAYKRK